MASSDWYGHFCSWLCSASSSHSAPEVTQQDAEAERSVSFSPNDVGLPNLSNSYMFQAGKTEA